MSTEMTYKEFHALIDEMYQELETRTPDDISLEGLKLKLTIQCSFDDESESNENIEVTRTLEGA